MDINNDELIFVSPVYDTTFKYLWKSEKSRGWFIKLIYSLTHVDLTDYVLYDPIISTGNRLKDYELDILFLKGDNISKSDPFNIEMYKDRHDYNEIKSRLYIFKILAEGLKSGDNYIKRKGVPVNFCDYISSKDKNLSISQYRLRDISNNIECDDITIYDIFLPKFEGICYNGDENELEAGLALLHASSYEEMETIANGNKEALNIVDELKKLAIDQEFIGLLDKEVIRRKDINTARSEGYEEGILEGKLQDAKAMLNDGISIENISKYTGLDIDTINKLNKEL